MVGLNKKLMNDESDVEIPEESGLIKV